MRKIIEEFSIPGICDTYIAKGKNNLASKPKFSKWFNGCCIGESHTLALARSSLFDYVTLVLARRIKERQDELAAMVKSRAGLGNHPRNLAKFKVRRVGGRADG